jgi:TatA/E family protein of Tat protein translocase
MFGMSFTEIVIILAIALVVLGPDRLPGIARGLGKAMREFRRATREIQTSLEVEEVRRTIRERAQEVKDAVRFEPIIDPGTGKPIKDESDDLADQKAYLSPGGPQGPTIVRKPRRPTVATGTTVTAAATGPAAATAAAPEGGAEAADAEGPVERTQTRPGEPAE